jgi:putative methionine-R-sulfoxide reductase with GAF domain
VSTSPGHVPAAREADERRPGQLAQAPLPQRHRVWRDDPARRAVTIQALAAAAEPGEVAWFASLAGGRLVLGQVYGARTTALPGLAVAVGRGLTGKAAASARPELVDDYFAADTITHDFDRVVADESVARMLAVPVRCGHRVLGVVTVGARSPGHFSDRRIDAVTARARELEQALRLLDEHEQRLEAVLARRRDDNTAWLNEQVASGVHGISAALGELRSLVGDDPAVAQVLARLERSTTDLGRVVRGPLGVGRGRWCGRRKDRGDQPAAAAIRRVAGDLPTQGPFRKLAAALGWPQPGPSIPHWRRRVRRSELIKKTAGSQAPGRRVAAGRGRQARHVLARIGEDPDPAARRDRATDHRGHPPRMALSSATVYSPVGCMRASSACWRAVSLGCVPVLGGVPERACGSR